MLKISLQALCLSIATLIASERSGCAAEYPDHPVRIIVNVTAGGGVDTTMRVVGQRLEQRFGQPFVIENRPSASGNLGAAAVFVAPPDGYTLLASSGSPLAINGWIYKSLSYDPGAFIPISIMSRIPNVLAVRNGLPAKTVEELVAYAKKEPGKLTYASQGSGTASHLTAELFMMLTGTKLLHVPYKGTGPALNDLVNETVDMSFIPVSSAYGLAEGGKIRIIGVATDKRSSAMPNVPTLVESGYPDLVSSTWNAVSAPPGTPAPLLQKLNSAISEIIQEGPIQKRFQDLQLIPVGGNLAETASTVEKERQQWGKVVKAAGINPE